MEKQTKDGTFYRKVGPDDWEMVTRKTKDGTTFKKVGPDDWQPIETTPQEYIDRQKNSQERPWYAFDPRNIPAGAMKGLENLDKYTAAPIREFVTETVTGQDFSQAPTGSEQAQMLGATDKSYGEMWGLPKWAPGRDVSPADIYGFGLEVIQDPLILGAAARRGLKGAQKIMQGGSRPQVTSRAAQSQSAKAGASAESRAGAQLSGGGLTVEQSGMPFNVKKPQSLDELRDWKPSNVGRDMPELQRLQEIEAKLPEIETKPLRYHYKMFENPKAMKELKLKFESLPTDDTKKIAAYNQQMLDESTDRIKQTISDYSGNTVRGLSDAGIDFMDAAKTRYADEKEALGPVFQQLQRAGGRMPRVEAHDLVVGLAENSRLRNLLAQGEDGRFFLRKNTPRTGLSDQEHGLLSRVIDDLNDGMTFKEIQDTREFLRKAVDPKNPGATSEINKVRSYLLSKLEDMAGEMGPDVGGTFKRYAINEKNREAIEKIIGGRIEDLEGLYAANPSRVLKRVFANPNYGKIVRDYVGEDKFREMVAAYINSGVQQATDSVRGFSPSKFKTWLRSNSNRQFLEANADPEVVERLEALADYGYYAKRFLNDVNPSGTAATILSNTEPRNFTQRVSQQGLKGAITSSVASAAEARSKQKSAIKTVNELLSGDLKQRPTLMSRIKDAASGQALDRAAQAKLGAAGARALNQEARLMSTAEGDEGRETADSKPKGADKWANDGFKKLLEHSKEESTKRGLEGQKGALLKNKRTKNLLIAASDLKPGSKAMDRIFKKISGGAD